MKLMKHQKLRMGESAVNCAPLVYGMTVCEDMQCKDEMFRWIHHWIWTPFWSIWSFGLVGSAFAADFWLRTAAKEVPHLPSLTTRWWWMWALQWSAFVKSSHLADSGCMPNIYWHTRGLWFKRLGMFLVESTTQKDERVMKTWWFSRTSRSLYDWHVVPTRLGMTSWPVIWCNVSSRVKWTSKSLDQRAGYSSIDICSKMQPVCRAWRLGITTTSGGPQSSCWVVSRTGSWRSLVKRCCDLFQSIK